MTLSEIADTLREIRVSPVKSLGQNFLHDQNLARWIVDRVDLGPPDFVVEIGPGLGALTELLAARAGGVLALEKDGRLAEFLRSRFKSDGVEVRHVDAMDFDVRSLYAKANVKLVANLPYYLSSQLLMKFLNWPSPISLAVLMLQREMAQRLTAAPGTKDYGALTLFIQLHYSAELLRTIPASVFIPRPEVDSAVVRLRPRPALELPACDFRAFHELVRLGFSQRRKQLGKLLRAHLPDWPGAAERLGLDPQIRAERLDLYQWIALTNLVRPIPQTGAAQSQSEMFPVVDESDHVVRAAPRGEVHGNNLRHRAVHILLFNAQNEVFLQKRSRWKDRHPLVWDSSAAGHVDAGEEYGDAARRELREELGLETVLRPLVRLSASERTGQEFIWLYTGLWDGPIAFDPVEIEAGEYFPSETVTAWTDARPSDFAPGFVECWKAWLNRTR
jgi:16S rRNA (adenine1518-N6/adenine1519-N6)-dimethyltransferase